MGYGDFAGSSRKRMACEHQSSVFTCLEMEISFDSTSYGSVSGIVNDPTYEYAKESNEKAIRFLDLLWQEGYRIYGIGGSDSHNLIEERYDGALEHLWQEIRERMYSVKG